MLYIMTEIHKSKIEGLGLFAKQFIPKGTIIWKFTNGFDMKISKEKFNSFSKQIKEYLNTYGWLSKKSNNYCLATDNAKYTNHSNNPNTLSTYQDNEDEAVTKAIKDIQIGEEITENYKMLDKNYKKLGGFMKNISSITDEILKISEKEPPQNKSLKGFISDIENDTTKNSNFRKVLYTGKNSQLVLMSLNPKEDIGDEIHDVDQFFRIDFGSGKVVINGDEHKISDGFAIVIPAGAKHNIIAGDEGLKLYSIYSPPHHVDKIIHKTKAEALTDKTDVYKGKTTEL